MSNGLFNKALIENPYTNQRDSKQVSITQSADNVSFATKQTGDMK
jgi:hypothetical protein